MRDLRFAFRMLLKSPGFTVVAVLTLALGLSANTTIFGLVSTFFFNPLPVKDPHQLVMVMQKSGFWGLPHGHSWLDYRDYQARVKEFSDVLALFLCPVHLSASGTAPERTWVEAVSGNYFSMLGAQAALGRLFLPGEGDTVGADPVVVLAHACWQSRFGGDPAVVGRSINLNGRPFTVIGVAAPEFTGAEWAIAVSAFLPATMLETLLGGRGGMLTDRGAPVFKVMARLRPEATLAEARAAVQVVAKQLEAEYPREHRESTVLVVPEQQCRPEPSFSEFMPLAAAVFMGMVGLILFIACANVANLMFSRAVLRQREMGIRAALGASRGQLIRQLLTESVVLAVIASGVGIAFAWWSGGLLAGFTPTSDIPVRTDQGWDWRVFAFTFAVAVLAGILTGLAPALRATRLEISTVLKEGGPTGTGPGRHLFRSGLVIAQVAVCLIVLVGGGLFVQSLRQAARLELGFRTDHLVMASLDLGLQGYSDTRGRQFHQELRERIASLPGVSNVTLAATVPFDYGVRLAEIGAEGQTTDGPPGKDGYLPAAYNAVDPAYLAAMGITLLQGRDFTAQDNESAPHVAILNQTAARRLWPDQDPIGKRFRLDRGGDLVQVIGVARDGKYVMLGEQARPFVYAPLAQRYSSPVTLHVRTEGDPLGLVPSLRHVLATLDPDLPIYNVRTMDEHLRTSAFGLMPLRVGATLAAVQGALALVLAVMGVYGLVAYAVSQRTREIGIRMALGAQGVDVLRLVVREGSRLTAIGLAIGLVVSLGFCLVLDRLLVGMSPVNLPVFVAVMALLAGVAALACYLPARRAVRIDPMLALRYE